MSDRRPTTGEQQRESLPGRLLPTVSELASEMHTDEQGTTMAAMVESARKHGLVASGVALTEKGLREQRVPLVTLVSPGHYLLVERVGPDGISVWDPDLSGPGQAGRRSYSPEDWKRSWSGVAMLVEGR